MEAHYCNRHSVHNVVDLILAGNDTEIQKILTELKQKNTKTYKNSLTS
jgi:hypothetical protein